LWQTGSDEPSPRLTAYAVRDIFLGKEILFDYALKDEHFDWLKNRDAGTTIDLDLSDSNDEKGKDEDKEEEEENREEFRSASYFDQQSVSSSSCSSDSILDDLPPQPSKPTEVV